MEQRTIFDVPEDTTVAKIIGDILQKNGVKDDIEEILKTSKASNLSVIINAYRNFFDKKISEKDVVELFSKQLNVSAKTATSIINDLKEKLLPFAKKITIGTQTEEKKPITAIPTRLINENKETIKKPVVEEPVVIEKEKPVERKTRAIKNPVKITEFKKTEDLPKKPDSYREPIE